MRVVRIITRLNIGGPSIQAIELASRLRPRAIDTVLVHGQLGQGEGDMQYLLRPDVDARQIASLRRRLAPVHDAAALWRLLALLSEVPPPVVPPPKAKG